MGFTAVCFYPSVSSNIITIPCLGVGYEACPPRSVWNDTLYEQKVNTWYLRV